MTCFWLYLNAFYKELINTYTGRSQVFLNFHLGVQRSCLFVHCTAAYYNQNPQAEHHSLDNADGARGTNNTNTSQPMKSQRPWPCQDQIFESTPQQKYPTLYIHTKASTISLEGVYNRDCIGYETRNAVHTHTHAHLQIPWIAVCVFTSSRLLCESFSAKTWPHPQASLSPSLSLSSQYSPTISSRFSPLSLSSKHP